MGRYDLSDGEYAKRRKHKKDPKSAPVSMLMGASWAIECAIGQELDKLAKHLDLSREWEFPNQMAQMMEPKETDVAFRERMQVALTAKINGLALAAKLTKVAARDDLDMLGEGYGVTRKVDQRINIEVPETDDEYRKRVLATLDAKRQLWGEDQEL